jgi:hypothetical protein
LLFLRANSTAAGTNYIVSRFKRIE